MDQPNLFRFALIVILIGLLLMFGVELSTMVGGIVIFFLSVLTGIDIDFLD